MKQVKQSQQQPQVAKPTIVEADTQVNVNFSSICRCRFNFRFRFHFRLKLSPKLNGLTNLGGKMEFGRYIYIYTLTKGSWLSYKVAQFEDGIWPLEQIVVSSIREIVFNWFYLFFSRRTIRQEKTKLEVKKVESKENISLLCAKNEDLTEWTTCERFGWWRNKSSSCFTSLSITHSLDSLTQKTHPQLASPFSIHLSSFNTRLHTRYISTYTSDRELLLSLLIFPTLSGQSRYHNSAFL